jgi:hypothetical protein
MSEEFELGDLPTKTKKKSKRATVQSEDKPRRRKLKRTKSKEESVEDKPRRRKLKRAKPKAEQEEKPTKKRSSRRRRQRESDVSEVKDGSSVSEGLELEFEHHQQEVLERIPTVMEDQHRHVVEYGQMFNTLSTMARIAEEKYIKDKQSRDMYAALKAYAEMREIIADIRAMADFSQFAEKIKDEIVDAVAQQAAAALVEYHKDSMSLLQTNLEGNVLRIIKPKIKSMAQDAGVKIKEAQTSGFRAADELFTTGR